MRGHERAAEAVDRSRETERSMGGCERAAEAMKETIESSRETERSM